MRVGLVTSESQMFQNGAFHFMMDIDGCAFVCCRAFLVQQEPVVLKATQASQGPKDFGARRAAKATGAQMDHAGQKATG